METSSLKQLFHECMPLFIALGDEIRLTIVEALSETAFQNCGGDFSVENLSKHGLNVRQITEKTSLSRPAISHHLKLLKDTGLVAVNRIGTCNYYYLTISQCTKRLMGLGRELQSFFSTKESSC